VYQVFTGKQRPRLELDEVRGLEGVKETTLQLPKPDGSGDLPLRIAVVNGLGNAKKLIKELEAGEVMYDFVEVMACPSGCINGGGQPKGDVEKRLKYIYELDRTLPIRQSHENPLIKKLYDEYLGEYGSHTAHELLHVEPVYGRMPGKADDAVPRP
jgi:iron only hydrogenase large subunit-like protein